MRKSDEPEAGSPQQEPVPEKVARAISEGREPPKPPGAKSGRWDRTSYGGIVWNEGADPKGA